MFNILKLNDIDSTINKILTSDNYKITSSTNISPDAIILRSHSMHDYEIPETLLAVARAGAGVNNIPIDKMTKAGIPVFNAPGANANAVKELILCAMLTATRNFINAVEWTKRINPTSDIHKVTEEGKKKFVGPEIRGKKMGVIGLGYVGRMVANSAVSLDMEVYGYDPYISVDGAWSLSRSVKHITSLDRLLEISDFITMHVPLTKDTFEMINEKTIKKMKKSPIILNFARGDLVNNQDILKAISEGTISKYVTDFPEKELIGKENVIVTPHLGASTPEAETQCAKMAAISLKEYLENGNITNSVNFPNVTNPRSGDCRITILHENVSNMISQASSYLASKGINIENIVSSSKNDIAYMIIDVTGKIPRNILTHLSKQEGFIRVRVFD